MRGGGSSKGGLLLIQIETVCNKKLEMRAQMEGEVGERKGRMEGRVGERKGQDAGKSPGIQRQPRASKRMTSTGLQ